MTTAPPSNQEHPLHILGSSLHSCLASTAQVLQCALAHLLGGRICSAEAPRSPQQRATFVRCINKQASRLQIMCRILVRPCPHRFAVLYNRRRMCQLRFMALGIALAHLPPRSGRVSRI